MKCEMCGEEIKGTPAYFGGLRICQECWVWERPPKNQESRLRRACLSSMRGLKSE